MFPEHVSTGSFAWLARRRFLALFIALILFLIVYPALHEEFGTQFVFYGLFTVLFLTTLLGLCTKRASRFIAIVLAIPTVTGLWTGFVLPDLPRIPLIVLFHLTSTLFFAFTVS